MIMKYNFEDYGYYDERYNEQRNGANIYIDNSDAYGNLFATEIRNLSDDYLNEIVPSLQKVLSGELEQYDFGYEIYSIDCRKDISQVIDTFDGWKSIAEIPTQEVYELMRDWRAFKLEHGVSDV
jgi:hypothetical protein